MRGCRGLPSTMPARSSSCTMQNCGWNIPPLTKRRRCTLTSIQSPKTASMSSSISHQRSACRSGDIYFITEGRFFCYRAVITKEPQCMFRSHKCESITEDRIESNLSKTKNIPPKAVIFSDYICTFAMSLMILLVLICSNKVSEKSDMAKS